MTQKKLPANKLYKNRLKSHPPLKLGIFLILIFKKSYGVRLSTAIPQEKQDYEKKLMMQAVDLISKGKVNAKNAFDLPTEFTDVIPAFVRRSAENGWIEVSQGLDASAKIYGYRVDALHSDTYKIRGGLYRNMKENENQEEDSKNEDANKKKAKVFLE